MIHTPVVSTSTDPDATELNVAVKVRYAKKLRDLLQDANKDGYVITVELAPLEPLAMGNYRMIGHVRGAL